jgi:hypothetical protein
LNHSHAARVRAADRALARDADGVMDPAPAKDADGVMDPAPAKAGVRAGVAAKDAVKAGVMA